MKRIQVLALLFILFVLAACDTTSAPSTPVTDWCYQFDFATGSYSLSVINGSLTSKGLETSSGVLTARYTHGSAVVFTYFLAEAKIDIPAGTSRSVSAGANIFGLQTNLSDTVTSSQIAYLSASASGSQTFTNTATFSATVNSDTKVTIRKLQVFGNGSNPFGTSNCSDLSSPTETPSIDWCYDVDFRVGTDDWFPFFASSLDRATYSAGVGWLSPQGDGLTLDQITIQYELIGSGGTIRQIDFYYDGALPANGGIVRAINGTGSFLIPLTDDYPVVMDTNPVTVDADDYILIGIQSDYDTTLSDINLLGALSRLTFYGSGDMPFDGDNPCDNGQTLPTSTYAPTFVVTPTQLPTSTAFPTYTPYPTSTRYPTNTPYPTPTIVATGTPDPGDNNNTYTPNGTCENHSGTEPTSDTNGSWTEWLWGGVTNYFTCSVMPIFNFVSSLVSTLATTVTNIWNFLSEFVQNAFNTITAVMRLLYDTLRILIINLLDDIKDWLNKLWLVLSLIWDLLGIVIKNLLGDILESLGNLWSVMNLILGVLGSVIGIKIAEIVASIASMILYFEYFKDAILPYFLRWLDNLWNMFLFNIALWLLRGLLALVSLFLFMRDLLDAIMNFVLTIWSFMMSGFVFVGLILSLWTTSTPLAPPGLPDCVAAPLASNICAVYYILEYTFFSGVGAFIIPALVVYLSLLVVFFFLETISERIKKLWRILGD